MELPNISHWGGKTKLLRRYAVDGDKAWSAFNPSIQMDEDGKYWIVYRSSNYYFNEFNNVAVTTEHAVRNRLFICSVDADSLEIDETSIKKLDMTRLNPQMVRGIEDARLYFDGFRWCLSATHLEKYAPMARIAVLSVDSLQNLDVLSFNVLEAPDEERVEKNWMPIHKTSATADVQADFMYNCQTVLYKSKFSTVSENPATSKFRGGTQLLPLEDGTYLAVIHETYKIEEDKFNPTNFSLHQVIRGYSHRFVRFDKDFKIIEASDPFKFRDKRIEFAAGIAPYKNGFIISFGSQDIASYVATISSDNVFKQLKGI